MMKCTSKHIATTLLDLDDAPRQWDPNNRESNANLAKMKALTLKQPWASLVASGRKTIELRSRRTHYRGEILICAGLGMASPEQILTMFVGILPRGQAVCISTIADCRPAVADDRKAACCRVPAEHFAWVLKDIRPVEPFTVTGQLGFFPVDDELIVIRKVA